MNENRGPWYLLTGLIVGVVLGLVYSWVVQPTQYVNTTPASLRPDFKDQYRAMIAAAYMANGDLVRAKARLELLQDEDPYQTLAEQAQRMLAEGNSPNQARALGLLAVALGQPPSQVTPPPQGTSAASPQETIASSPEGTSTISPSPSPTRTPEISPTAAITVTQEISVTVIVSTPQPTGEETQTPEPTETPLPTRTPTATQGAPFVLADQERVCDPDLEGALIQVWAYDASQQPVPGVEVEVSWDGGQDHFFTGLKPEYGLGYADFNMTPEVEYTIRIAAGGQPISGLTSPECEDQQGERYWGSWSLVFEQP